MSKSGNFMFLTRIVEKFHTFVHDKDIKKGLYALVPLHRNLENFKAKITTKGNRTIKLASMGAS